MKSLHIAGLVIAALLAVWAIYVVATKKEGDTYGSTALRFFSGGMLNVQPIDNPEHASLTPGIAKGFTGHATAGAVGKGGKGGDV